MTFLLVALLGYVAIQLCIGAWVSRRIRTESDYLVAGRTLGPVMASSSIFATWFGAETCVGAAGEVYQHGLAAVSSDPFGYGLCLLLFGAFFATPIYERGIVTLADLFRERFSPAIERAVALMLIPSSLLWAGAQIRAFGHVLSTGSDMTNEVGIAIAAGVAVTYTVFGGLLADAYNDLIQGGVLIVCLVTLAFFVVANTGGIEGTFAALATSAHTDVDTERSVLGTLNDWAVPVIGSLFAQELSSRVVASRSARVARRATLSACVVYILVGSIPVLLGAIAHSTLPGVDSERVLAALAMKHMHGFGYVVFAGALVSAILSTVDSSLLVCGSLVSHNLAKVVLKNPSEERKVQLARASVFAFGACAYGLAHAAEGVHELVQQASAFGSAGIVVTGTLGLFTAHGGPRSALAALLSGAFAWLTFEYGLHSEAAFLVSFAAALASYAVTAVLLEPTPERPDDQQPA